MTKEAAVLLQRYFDIFLREAVFRAEFERKEREGKEGGVVFLEVSSFEWVEWMVFFLFWWVRGGDKEGEGESCGNSGAGEWLTLYVAGRRSGKAGAAAVARFLSLDDEKVDCVQPGRMHRSESGRLHWWTGIFCRVIEDAMPAEVTSLLCAILRERVTTVLGLLRSSMTS